MSKKKTHNEYLTQIEDKYNGEYEILEKYINTHTPILTKHNKCGHEWYVRPHDLLSGHGCPACGIEKYASKKRLTLKEFEVKFKQITKGEMLLLSDYINSRTKVKVRCNVCGYEWQVTPNNILSKNSSCPVCKESHGEMAIKNYLIKNNIKYKRQYKIEECKYINPLPFDFAIFNNNELFALIEYQGRQHYEYIDFFGKNGGFEKQQKRDAIKKKYCVKNHIPLIEIPYTIKDIEKFLENKINIIQSAL